VTLAIIGGTGLESLALKNPRPVDVVSAWGEPSSVPVIGSLAGHEVIFLNRHGCEHSIPPHRINYRANIDTLVQCGVSGIIAVNAVGAIDFAMKTGCLVIPDQLIDYTWGREHTFAHGPDCPVQHVDFSEPYDAALRRCLLQSAKQRGETVIDGGVYGATQGPRFETAAEIRRFEQDGCQLVGMTGMPEASLAREKNIPYACLALVVNPAAGKMSGVISMEQIAEVMTAAVPRIVNLLTTAAASISG
jgi:5'-methylthioinosine phosphorylase